MQKPYRIAAVIVLSFLMFWNALSSIPPHERVLRMIKEKRIAVPYHLAHRAEAADRGINTLPRLSPIGIKSYKRDAVPQSSTFRAIAILVQFSDNTSQVQSVFFDSLLYAETTHSLRDYYREVSYGTLDIVTMNFPSSMNWYTMPQTYAYYVNGNNGFGAYPQNAQKLAEDAIAAADPFVDFSQYDNNSDGFVDALFIIHAGPGAEYTGNPNDIWSHQWSTSTPQFVDGVYASVYSMEPEYWASPGDMTCGVYAHEAGHAIFGLPDLYDYGYDSRGLGMWSLMAFGSWGGNLGDSPSHPDAWSRYAMGLITPTNVVTNTAGASIPSVENDSTIYRLWTNGSMGTEYFLVENRQKIGYDTSLPGDGLCIYHVDETQPGNDNQWYPGHTGYGHYKVALEQADGLWDLEQYHNSGDSSDLYPGWTGNTTFSNTSTPDSKNYNFANTHVAVTNIGPSGATMTADLAVEVIPPEIDVSPTSFNLSLGSGDTTSRLMTISNAGPGELEFQISASSTTLVSGKNTRTLQSIHPYPPDYYKPLAKGEADVRVGHPIAFSSGGPDAYGYLWKDSDEPGGPVFSWVDITSIGTPVYLSDDSNSGLIPLGFNFMFYGNTFDHVAICSNGWVSFTNTSGLIFNYPLPTTYAPENLIALMAADLYPTGNCYYYSDVANSRFIVEYYNWGRYGIYNPDYTMEIILYTNGRIVLQYLSLNGDYTTNTTGIQNATQDIGLTVAFNAPYLHNNLAVEFSRGPGWLSFDPISGVVPAGQSQDVQLLFDAIGMVGGTYNANISIANNDSDENPFIVPVNLTVTGQPNIIVSADSIDFGSVFIGASRTDTVTIRNTGSDALVVTSITTSNPTFSAVPDTFTVPALSERHVAVTFSPAMTGEVLATMSIISNDPHEGTVGVSLHGVGMEPPNISVAPDSLSADLLTNQQTTRTITVNNVGASDLVFSVSTRGTAYDMATVGKSRYRYAASNVMQENQRTRMVEGNTFELNGGVPRNSNDASIPSVNPPIKKKNPSSTTSNVLIFRDQLAWGYNVNVPLLEGLGATVSTATSGEMATLDLSPFDVVVFESQQTPTFYSNYVAAMNRFESYVNAGGVIEFHCATWSSYRIPNLPFPGGMQTRLSESLDNINHIAEPSHPIVAGATDPLTGNYASHEAFENLPGGAHIIVINQLGQPTTVEYTVGSGTMIVTGMTWEYGYANGYNSGDPLLPNALGYSMELASGANWLSINPLSGVVPPGSFIDLTVMFDATGMYGGDYNADVLIASNDPDEDTIAVPAHLHVTGVADITLSDSAINYGTVFIGVAKPETLRVTNDGTDILNVNNIGSDNGDYTVSVTSFSLNPCEHRDVTVTFTPSVVGTRSGTLTVASNDPDEPNVTASLQGEGAYPPDIAVTPSSLHADLLTDQTHTDTLTISNEGASDLTYDIAVNFLGSSGRTQATNAASIGGQPVASEPPSDAPYVPGQVIVKFKPGVSPAQAVSLRTNVRASVAKKFKLIGAEVWNLSGTSVQDAIAQYRNHPLIKYIEPNYIVRAVERIPNDPMFSQLWGMRKIQAPAAWDRATGTDVLMGVIDTGVDDDHVDLSANIWTNPGEIPGNGIDDDGNGYIDDIHGWDFYNNDNDPSDDNGHGSHVSGTIAAVGNNGVGVVGVCWSARIMALKFLGADGSGSTDNAISALEYATMMHARLTSNSWGGGGYSQALYDAIQAAGNAGALFIAAAGNNSMDNDLYPHYPSSYDLPNLIAVASTTNLDELSWFSNYGLTSVDLAAPGSDILSTFPGNTYGTISGTSMATPHVSGVAGLILSVNPFLGWVDVKDIIMSSVDTIPALFGRCMTGGRLNAAKALQRTQSWLRIDQLAGIIPPGSSVQIPVTFDASGMYGGNYEAEVRVRSNDPDESNVIVPASLHVTGVPDIAVSDTMIDYGTVFIFPGVSKRDTLRIANVGTDVLTVSNITSDNSEFTVDTTNFDVATRGYFDVVMTFVPTAVGEQTGTLTISNNDPDEPTMTVHARGLGALPPDITVTPTDTVKCDLLTGQQCTRTFTVRNDGVSSLDFGITIEGDQGSLASVHYTPASLASTKVIKHGIPISPLDLRKFKGDMPATISRDRPNAIDKGTSSQKRSVDVPAPERITGLEVFGSPENMFTAGPRTRGNLFTCTVSTTLLEHRFYLNPLSSTQLWFLVYEGSSQVGNYNLISASDVSPVGPGEGWYSSGPVNVPLVAGRCYLIVASFEQVSNYYNQQGISPYPISASFGQLTAGAGWNWAPTSNFPPDPSQNVPIDAFGEPVAYYQALVTGVGTTWLSLDPMSGVLPSGLSVDVSVTFNAEGLYGGDYRAKIHVLSNDPDEDTVTVPAHLHVTGVADIAISDTTLDYDTVFVFPGMGKRDTLRVSNDGTDVLTVSGITSDNSDYTVDTTHFSLVPDSHQDVVVTFLPSVAGERLGTLTVSSDDPDEPVLTVHLRGIGAEPPDISVSSDSLTANLSIGEQTTRTLTVSNIGASGLNFHTKIDYASMITVSKSEAPTPREISRAGKTVTISFDPRAYCRAMTFSREHLTKSASIQPLHTQPYTITKAVNPSGLRILLAMADDGASYISSQLLTYPDILSIDVYDTRTATPTLTELQSYDAVVVWTNYLPLNPTALGDVLADYVDQGGGVVLGTFSWYQHCGSYSLCGRILESAYTPLRSANMGNHYTTASMVVLNPSHPIMNGVVAATDEYRDYTTLTPGSELLAQWSDGEAFVAVKGSVVAINSYVGDYYRFTGDVPLIVHNSIVHAAGRRWLSVVPEDGTVAPGDSANLAVTFDATYLSSGTYYASIILTSNDPNEDSIIVPVGLRVGLLGEFWICPVGLNFGVVPVDSSKIDSVSVSNTGRGMLEVTSVTSTDTEFTVLPTNVSIPPLSSETFYITYHPTVCSDTVGFVVFVHNGASSPDSVFVIGRAREAIQLGVANGWNLISVPFRVEESQKELLFPTARSDAFAYEGRYVTCDTLYNGKGYWVKFGSSQSVPLWGMPWENPTCAVRKGWNMIGATNEPVLVGSITHNPSGNLKSRYWGYCDHYEATDTLLPGRAYWVKVGSSGEMTFPSAMGNVVKPAATSSPAMRDDWNTITVRDAKGRSQTLYFGVGTEDDARVLDLYELPPLPPEGSFDARFVTQRSLEIHPAEPEKTLNYPIGIYSPVYPITLEWNVGGTSGVQYSVIEPSGKQPIALDQHGKITLTDHSVRSLTLKVHAAEQIPAEFALEQNYPNPFNPVTSIRYALPTDARVELTVYNTLGQCVVTLIGGRMEEAGYKSVDWNASSVPSGVYFYRLDATGVTDPTKTFSQIRKMVLMK